MLEPARSTHDANGRRFGGARHPPQRRTIPLTRRETFADSPLCASSPGHHRSVLRPPDRTDHRRIGAKAAGLAGPGRRHFEFAIQSWSELAAFEAAMERFPVRGTHLGLFDAHHPASHQVDEGHLHGLHAFFG
jgi:hypothetical protein